MHPLFLHPPSCWSIDISHAQLALQLLTSERGSRGSTGWFFDYTCRGQKILVDIFGMIMSTVIDGCMVVKWKQNQIAIWANFRNCCCRLVFLSLDLKLVWSITGFLYVCMLICYSFFSYGFATHNALHHSCWFSWETFLHLCLE